MVPQSHFTYFQVNAVKCKIIFIWMFFMRYFSSLEWSLHKLMVVFLLFHRTSVIMSTSKVSILILYDLNAEYSTSQHSTVSIGEIHFRSQNKCCPSSKVYLAIIYKSFNLNSKLDPISDGLYFAYLGNLILFSFPKKKSKIIHRWLLIFGLVGCKSAGNALLSNTNGPFWAENHHFGDRQ